jgi:monoamine oxidase
VRFDEVMKRMRRPVQDEAIHICGEAYSNYQGWVEGALQTAELMLEEHFHLPRPDWIPADYDLGP